MKNLVAKDKHFAHLEEDAYDVIEKYGKVKGLNKEKYQGEDGKIDMCKAMDDWAKEEREIGHESGLREGRELGLKVGIQFVIENMIKEGLGDDDIIRFTHCSRELLEKVRIS